MSSPHSFLLDPIGTVHSTLKNRKNAPRQSDEGAPQAILQILPRFADAVADLKANDDILVFTWLHLANRETMKVHPRGVPGNPLTGVFATRSPDRPNPIGLHRTKIVEIHACEIRVAGLEAVDGTPIVDIKPVLCGEVGLR